jgi:hypothetical protein
VKSKWFNRTTDLPKHCGRMRFRSQGRWKTKTAHEFLAHAPRSYVASPTKTRTTTGTILTPRGWKSQRFPALVFCKQQLPRPQTVEGGWPRLSSEKRLWVPASLWFSGCGVWGFEGTDDDGGRGENGAELAGGERVQGAQAAFEFGRGYAALAAEAAKKIFGGR